jgi:hypothetical protein
MARAQGARKGSSGATQQLSLFQHIPLDEHDIGAELLPILTKGLYTNPLDCIREYVQNGVDANATELTIKITGNSVLIRDNGTGMDKETITKARALGSSTKRMDENVGFRGIGIYSAYDLCSRLLLTTKSAGEKKIHIMRFNFAGMREELAIARTAGTSSTVALSKLLYDYTDFGEEDADDLSSHFTIIQLEDLSDTHIRNLADRTKMRRYVLHNLPVDFDEKFKYRDHINSKLRENVPGFKAVKITLQSDGLDDEVVAKPNIDNLLEPTIEFIQSGSKDVAYYWACLTSGRTKIGGQSKINPKAINIEQEYQGFVYKYKGFTIGDRRRFRDAFKIGSGTLYGWYTGEIYVVDPKVVPNAERDDFEASTAKNALETAVLERLGKLEKKASTAQQQAKAADTIDQWVEALPEIQSRLKNNTGDVLELHGEIHSAIQELERQKTKAAPARKDELNNLLTKAKELKKNLQSVIDGQEQKSKKSKRPSTPTSVPASTLAPTPKAEPRQDLTRTLLEVLRDSGWEFEGEANWLLQTVDSVLIDILGVTSRDYRAIVKEIDQRCQEELAG